MWIVFVAVNEILMLEVLVENSLQPIAEDPELTEGQGDWDGQQGEFDARLLAGLYSSIDRRFRKQVRISNACRQGKS